MRALSSSLLLASLLAALGGCGRAPSPPASAKTQAATPAAVKATAAPARPVFATPQALAAEPAPAAVELEHPPIEPLPAAVAMPRKKVTAALREAGRLLQSGHIDERDVGEPATPAGGVDAASPAPPTPSRANALALYRDVLVGAPNNPEARAGIDAVAAALVARARAAMARGDMVSAQRDIDRITLLRPDQADLAALKPALEAGWHAAGLLARGRRYESVGALISPRSANAAVAYRHALALVPDNAAAKAGLDRVESVFIARALADANSANYPQAELDLVDASRVQGGSPALRDAQASLLAIRQRHAQLLVAQADAALDAGDADRAEPFLSRIEYAMPGSPSIARLRARIGNVRLYGRHLPGQVFSDALAAGGRGPDMVAIAVGRFRMGSVDGDAGHDDDETPARMITFTHGFAMARSEISVGQFARFVKATNYRTDAERSGSSLVYDEGKGKLVSREGVSWRDDYLGRPAAETMPVLHVSWNDARAYTIWLSSQSTRLYRLPSEAEFEYALRAGSSTIYPWPDTDPPHDVGNLAGRDRSPGGRRWGDAFANYADGYWGPAPVMKFKANAFGLYDMVGNVSEWVTDCWHDGYRRAPADASAWVNPGCTQHVVRGASWASAPTQARSAWRGRANAGDASARIGFRVVREL